jgi:hypothetical protein
MKRYGPGRLSACHCRGTTPGHRIYLERRRRRESHPRDNCHAQIMISMTAPPSPAWIPSCCGCGLLDESRLFVHLIVVGRGKHRFPEGSKSRPRKLVEATTFRRSALYLTCQPADQ